MSSSRVIPNNLYNIYTVKYANSCNESMHKCLVQIWELSPSRMVDHFVKCTFIGYKIISSPIWHQFYIYNLLFFVIRCSIFFANTAFPVLWDSVFETPRSYHAHTKYNGHRSFYLHGTSTIVGLNGQRNSGYTVGEHINVLRTLYIGTSLSGRTAKDLLRLLDLSG